MALIGIGRLAVMLLVAGLAGCVDARLDVDVTSMTTAKAVMTQVMAQEVYAMAKSNGAQAVKADHEFCARGELTQNSDGSATCVLTKEGAFATLALGGKSPAITYTPVGANLVRVALPTADIKRAIGVHDAMDQETRDMVDAFFKDHAITLHFSGLEVTETNMVLAADRKSAERVIPFVDLIEGTADLPDALYAVVRVP